MDGGGLLRNILGQVGGAANTAAKATVNNGLFNYLFSGAKNVAQDIGVGLGYNSAPGLQASRDAAINMAQKAHDKAAKTTDPAEKARLQKIASDTLQTVSQGAQEQAQQYSPEVQQNPLLRALNAGVQVGTGADIAAHPIASAQGVVDLAKGGLNAVAHPIKTLGALGEFLAKPGENTANVLKSLPWDVQNSGKLQMQPNGVTNFANRLLLGQYKNPEAFSRDPLGVVSTLNNRYGLTKPQQIADAASVVTGSVDNANPAQALVHKKVVQAIGNADPVDTSGVMDNAINIMRNATDVTGPAEKKAIDMIEKGLQNPEATTKYTEFLNNEMKNGAQGGLSADDPKRIFEFTRSLDQKAALAGNAAYDKSGNLVKPDQQQLQQFYKSISTQLKDRLFNGATTDPNVTRMGANNMRLPSSWTPDELKAFEKVSPKLAQDISSQENVGGLRSIESLFTQGGQMATRGNLNLAKGAVGLNQTLQTGLAFLHPNPATIGLAAESTNAGKQALGKVLSNASKLNSGAGQSGMAGVSALTQMLTGKPQATDLSQTTGSTTISPTEAAGGKARYTMTDPIQTGIVMNPNDYAKQRSALQQRIGQEKINNPTQAAADQGQLDALDTTFGSQQKLRDAWVGSDKSPGVSQVLTVGNTAYNAIQQAPPDFFQALSKGYDSLKTASDGKYAQTSKYLQYLQNATGMDFTQYKTKEAVVGAIDAAIDTVKSQWVQQVQGFSGTQASPQGIPQGPAGQSGGNNLQVAPQQARPTIPQGAFGNQL